MYISEEKKKARSEPSTHSVILVLDTQATASECVARKRTRPPSSADVACVYISQSTSSPSGTSIRCQPSVMLLVQWSFFKYCLKRVGDQVYFNRPLPWALQEMKGSRRHFKRKCFLLLLYMGFVVFVVGFVGLESF